MNPARVLYVQHAGNLGGSAMSLLYLLQGLDSNRYEPVVALVRPSKEVRALYEDQGFKTLDWAGVRTFEHTTAKHWSPWRPGDWIAASGTFLGMRSTAHNIHRLVKQVRPDIVHLNSAVLAMCAKALSGSGVPVVWHIREHPVRGVMGLRRGWLRRGMDTWPSELIYISESDRNAWGAHGVVIPNIVDANHFDRSVTGKELREKLGISHESTVLLYTGGPLRIKGVLTVLETMALLRQKGHDVHCLMPGSQLTQLGDVRRLIRGLVYHSGMRTLSMRIDDLVRDNSLENACIRLPFQTDIVRYVACSDIVLFPSLRPHFARPVIEAGMMAKPVVVSRIEGIEELVDEGKTGLVVEPGNPAALANAVQLLMTDKKMAGDLGEGGYAKARDRYEARSVVIAIERIYEQLLTR
jgi:glycosyltransferase involved in cell wall biosynthesis